MGPMTNRRRLSALVVAAICLPRWAVGMGSAPQPPKPPLTIPIAVHRKGEVIDTTMRIVEHRDYEFGFRFRFKKNDIQDENRVLGLIHAYPRDITGPMINRNQIPLSLKIWQITEGTERPVFDRHLDGFPGPRGGTGSDFHIRNLTEVELRPGLYRMRVETLKDLPELATVDTEFRVGWFYNARPYDN